MKRVLIIEDEPTIKEILSDILKKAALIVDEADKGSIAMEKVSSSFYDLAIIDLVLPDIDGLDLLSWIKQKTPRTKIIMMSAFATIDSAVNAIKKGAENFIPKPFRPADVLAIVQRTLEEAKFDSPPGESDIEGTLKTISNSVRREIIKLLCSEPKMHLLEITRRLGIEDHTKVSFHLKILKESGVISQDSDKAYYLTKTGEEITQLLKMICERLKNSK